MRIGTTWAEMRTGRRTRRLRHTRRPGLGLARGCERLERRDCPAAMFSLEPPAAPIFEGDRATFTVRLSEPSSRPERVVISTVAETAALGSDYYFQNDLQLLFAPGVISKQFSISTKQDSLREGIETFRIVMTPANQPAAQPIVFRASIYDLVPTSVSMSDIRVVEGNDGTTNADFTVQVTAGSLLPVTVQYVTRDGTATAGSDYTATSGTLTFAPGELVKTVSVPILGDRIAETDETFKLLLSNPSRGTTIRTPQATCTIVNDETDQLGFQVTLKFPDGPNGSVPQAVRTVALQAVNRWARIITGDLPSVTANGFYIDDFEMSIQMGLLGGTPTDGPSNILANARPTAFRDNGSGLPYSGITGLDPADVSNPALLLDTITHEMGHAFGFTPGANVFSRWIVGDTFVGTNALREFNSVFRRTVSSVPLEAGVRAHWDETTFGDELMSPITTGAAEYISRITVGALQDMGYTVNYVAAEPYVRPLTVAPQVAATSGVTTVSAFPSGTKSPTSTKSPQPAAPTTNPAVVVKPVAANVIPFVASGGWKNGIDVVGSTVPSKDVPLKANGGPTLLTQSSVKIG